MTDAQTVGRPLRVLAILAALAVLVGLVVAAGAEAAKRKPCGDLVIADWYDNGRVDFLYPQRCYREAIKGLPPDVTDYSSAKEEIQRALADAATRPPVTSPIPLEDAPPPCKGNKKKCQRVFVPPGGGTDGTDTVAGPGSDSSDPSSVPVPLIVLGGLSLLLLAAGSAGYLARRFGNRGDDEGGEPPAAV